MNERVRTSIKIYMKIILYLVVEAKRIGLWGKHCSLPSFVNVFKCCVIYEKINM